MPGQRESARCATAETAAMSMSGFMCDLRQIDRRRCFSVPQVRVTVGSLRRQTPFDSTCTCSLSAACESSRVGERTAAPVHDFWPSSSPKCKPQSPVSRRTRWQPPIPAVERTGAKSRV